MNPKDNKDVEECVFIPSGEFDPENDKFVSNFNGSVCGKCGKDITYHKVFANLLKSSSETPPSNTPAPNSSSMAPYYLGKDFNSKIDAMANVLGCESVDVLQQAVLLYERAVMSNGKLVLNIGGKKHKIGIPYLES